MPEPLLLLILHIFGVLFLRASQTGNQATLNAAQLYDEHREARALMSKRNAVLKYLMVGSVVLVGGAVYLLTLLQAGHPMLPTVDPLMLVLAITALSTVSLATVGWLVSRQTQATRVIMDFDFTENRVTVEEIGILNQRLTEIEHQTRPTVAERYF